MFTKKMIYKAKTMNSLMMLVRRCCAIKRIQLPLFILALLLIVIASCKKKNATPASTTPPPATTNPYYFTWKVNGVNGSISNPIAADSVVGGYHYYIIHNNAIANPAHQLIMSVFPFDATTWGLESAEYIDGNYNDYSSSGFVLTNLQLSVTRDSVHKTITGTFSFPLLNTFDNLDTVKITNGKFKVKYN